MSKYSNPVQEALGYSDEWIDLEVITPEVEGELWHEWQKGEDLSPEHYRWRAFRDYLKTHSALSKELFERLYALGERDPDRGMGIAMLSDLLIRKDCPVDLLERAKDSQEPRLVRTAQQVLARRT